MVWKKESIVLNQDGSRKMAGKYRVMTDIKSEHVSLNYSATHIHEFAPCTAVVKGSYEQGGGHGFFYSFVYKNMYDVKPEMFI